MNRPCKIAMHHAAFGWDDDAQFRFDAQFPAGSFTAVMGPSGSGKSTLLGLLAGFNAPLSGDIVIGDRSVVGQAPHERPVSMVFQDNNLFAHLTVGDNVGLGIHPGLRLSAHEREHIARALEQTGLSGLAERRPGELSGGQRQRVALARVLVRDRPVLLLDEAFSSLGPGLRSDMLRLCRALHDDRKLTTVMVTHEEQDAWLVADRICFIEAGRVHLEGPVDAVLSVETLDAHIRAYLRGNS